jgi:hypothetical protein
MEVPPRVVQGETMKVKIDIICPSQTVYYEVRWRNHWWSTAETKWCKTLEEAEALKKTLLSFYYRDDYCGL